jgi:F-type H+-transporting ATPase subunit delta
MDTSNIQVASRYAKSLLKQAIDIGVLDHVYKDALFFKKVGKSHKTLFRVLHSPILKSEKKLAILTSIFQSRIDPLTFHLLTVLSRRKREGLLSTIIDTFLEQYYTYKGVKVASVTTTFKLSDELIIYFKNLAKSLIPCKEVILTEYVNPSIQGGFILRIADQQLDNSLATKLNEFKKQYSIAGY